MFEIGASLREARSRQGLDLDEMESRTKVRAKYLRFLEEERFDQLPGDTYTKGFLRVYANALGLDGQLYLDEYNSRFLTGDDDVVARPRRVQPAWRSRAERRESRLVVLVLGAILLATALVIAAWRFGGIDTPSVTGLGDAKAPQTVTPNAQRITLEVRATRGPSFVEVRLRSGDQLYSGTLERGQTQRFVNTGFLLSVASPRNVLVRINGNRQRMQRGGELDISPATSSGG
jgi:transcriptional regulator with XRE-family HTH domain